MRRRTGAWLGALILAGGMTAGGEFHLQPHREGKWGKFTPRDKGRAGKAACASAIALPSALELPIREFGDSCTGTNLVTNYQNSTCNTVAYPGPEVVYAFDLTRDLDYIITLSPLGDADLGLFAVNRCGSPTSCLDFHDAIGPGSISEIPRLTSDWTRDRAQYYFYVDSYYAEGASSCGQYFLDVSYLLRAELVSFEVD